MTRLAAGLLTGLLIVAVVLSYLPVAFSHGSTIAAPRIERSLSSPPMALSSPSAHRGAAPSAAAHPVAAPSTGNCPTPTGVPVWSSPNFFSDAVVTFWVPGSTGLSGSNFQTVPCNNVIPTYTSGFWMNVTTNVALIAANVTVWGTTWPTPGNPAPDIPSFAPSVPRNMPMLLNPPYFHTAAFFFNVYRFFWPGSQVYFNITLKTGSASPSIVRSTSSSHVEPEFFSGGVNNATWKFYVADPWGTGLPGSANFTQAIQVSTIPSVLGTPAFEPNPKQQLQVLLSSFNPLGGPAIPIPMAQGTFTLTGTLTGVYYQNFGPVNHTTMKLNLPLGPYPGTKVQFNITAWLPWQLSINGQLGSIDRIYSPIYTFNWSANGGWWNPNLGLIGNAALTSTPDVTTTPGITSVLATGTPVNLTVHSYIENVTISTASVAFRYSDPNGFSTGTITMNPASKNTSYATLPGLPSGGTIAFSITAKDVFGNPVSSGNYSYTESGSTGTALPGGYGLFYAEAIDLSTGQLIPKTNFTISNSTWSESGVGNIYGFVVPVPLGGVGYLPVAFGSYTVKLGAFGASQSYTFGVSSATPFTVIFYFTSKPINPNTSVNAPLLVTIPAVVGLLGASMTSLPVLAWFKERRRKAEAEQRRITL